MKLKFLIEGRREEILKLKDEINSNIKRKGSFIASKIVRADVDDDGIVINIKFGSLIPIGALKIEELSSLFNQLAEQHGLKYLGYKII